MSFDRIDSGSGALHARPVHDTDTIRALLRDLLSTTRTVAPARLAAIDVDGWGQVRRIAEEHRLGPLLHYRCRTDGLIGALPGDVAEAWAGAHRDTAVGALRHRTALVRLADLFADMDVLALKGLWLAWHAYPDVALRPVRDIDLLVAPERALEAFDRLLANGFERLPRYAADPERALEGEKHLPGLYSRELGVLVELHARLIPVKPWAENPDGWGTPRQLLASAASDEAVGRKLLYPAPTDTLLHLILHAVYDHRFDNGPLVIDDVVWTVRTGAVDWSRFWRTVEGGSWQRGAMLLFDLAEREHGALPIDWGEQERGSTPSHLLDEAASLMFQESGGSALLSNMGALVGDTPWRVRIGNAAGRLTTSSETIGAAVGLEDESQRRWWHYFGWLRRRLQRLVTGLVGKETRGDARRAVAVARWLDAAR